MGEGTIMQNPLIRKCERCGAALTDEDVMKIQIEDGSWETIPLPVCPGCFAQQMRELALDRRQESERD
ncbi:MAG: hypothetical protein NWE76_08990 [Candidatus Bathyarchaeota archaeon]|nr:hypothetical protein [Candidatus Bathyarchaeota archaeon]